MPDLTGLFTGFQGTTGIVTKLTTEAAAPEPEPPKQDARILSKDELLRVLKQEFDARVVDDGPSTR